MEKVLKFDHLLTLVFIFLPGEHRLQKIDSPNERATNFEVARKTFRSPRIHLIHLEITGKQASSSMRKMKVAQRRIPTSIYSFTCHDSRLTTMKNFWCGNFFFFFFAASCVMFLESTYNFSPHLDTSGVNGNLVYWHRVLFFWLIFHYHLALLPLRKCYCFLVTSSWMAWCRLDDDICKSSTRNTCEIFKTASEFQPHFNFCQQQEHINHSIFTLCSILPRFLISSCRKFLYCWLFDTEYRPHGSFRE